MKTSVAIRIIERKERRSAFSLVELVMVIAIIAVLGAIAVPRLTKASQRAQANALQATLTNVRKAIDRYYAEHSRYPGYDPNAGSPDGVQFVDQLTLYTNAKGETSSTRDSDFKFGPYLSKPFPTSPVNDLNTVHARKLQGGAVPQGTTGWHTCLENGSFGLNATTVEVSAKSLDVSDVGTDLQLPSL